jgi:toxin ParE1/3/4
VTHPTLRPQAEIDLIERSRHYQTEGGIDLGERFFAAAVTALDAIGRMPGAGSPRVGEVCGIDGLRLRRIANFPCGWFYFASGDHVDVVRLPVILADIDQE